MPSHDFANSAGAPESQPISATSRRPTGVTVLAILSILFGIIGLLNAVSSLLMFLLRDSIPLVAGPMNELLDNHFGYRIFYLMTSGLGVIFSAILLLAGIGLLKMSRRARKLVIVYAVYAILATIVVNIVNLLFLYSPMLTKMEQQPDQQLMVAVTICVAIASAFFSLLFPIAILIYFLLPSVKQTFLDREQTTAA